MKERARLNPFRYGKPVPPDSFVGRTQQIRTLFSRIANGESTAVVGMPHIGKSSLLRYISDSTVRGDWLAADTERFGFVYFDCYLLQAQSDRSDFWSLVTSRIARAFRDRLDASDSQGLDPSRSDSFQLRRMFDSIGRSGHSVVLLVDEFERFLHHPRFNNPDFLGALRSISSTTDGLILVLASRLSVSLINRRTAAPTGSPYLNPTIEVNLTTLSEDEVEDLLAQSLSGTGLRFGPTDKRFILRASGGHPFLVQAAAAALFDAAAKESGRDDQYSYAISVLNQRVASHFEDTWRHLDSTAQTCVVLLALSEMRGAERKYVQNVLELASFHSFLPEIDRLQRIGLIETVAGADAEYSPTWHGERWRVSSSSFLQWLSDNVIRDRDPALGFCEWLEGRKSDGSLTKIEADRVLALAGGNTRKSPQPVRIFVSYAHEDERLMIQLGRHLSNLKRQGIVSQWHDRKITAGSDWKGEIDSHLHKARLVLLLLSPDFMASDYCYDVEMGRALELHHANRALVLPVLLRPVDIEGAPFAGLQALPGGGKPITSWEDLDAAFLDVTEGIKGAIRKLLGVATAT